MDRDLRIPFIMSDESIDLIRKMLDRDLSTRPTMAQVLAHPVSFPSNLLLRVVVLRRHRVGLERCALKQVISGGIYDLGGLRKHKGVYLKEFGYIGVIIDSRHRVYVWHLFMGDVMKEMVVWIWVCDNVRDEKFIHFI